MSAANGSAQVLHLDFIALADSAGDEARRDLIEAARRLAALDEVVSLGVIDSKEDGQAGSDFDLVFFFLLPDFEALEPFGTNEHYARFLQGAVAPVLKGFAGADVRMEAELPPSGAFAACLALTAPEETYDWEVREALADWAAGVAPRDTSIGLAVGERQRYRGVAIAFADEAMSPSRPAGGRFEPTLVFGRARTLA